MAQSDEEILWKNTMYHHTVRISIAPIQQRNYYKVIRQKWKHGNKTDNRPTEEKHKRAE